MASVPQTSITFLKGLADGSNVHWTRFYTQYEPVLRAFLIDRFPTVDADDVIQDTVRALLVAIPSYHYTPDEHGHFRNYLLGILRHKAVDHVRKSSRQADLVDRMASDPTSAPHADNAIEDANWKKSALEAAIDQLMCNPRINSVTREVFRHVALLHEPPEAVATLFGLTRNNVDQIKKRMISRLSEMVSAMTVTPFSGKES